MILKSVLASSPYRMDVSEHMPLRSPFYAVYRAGHQIYAADYLRVTFYSARP